MDWKVARIFGALIGAPLLACFLASWQGLSDALAVLLFVASLYFAGVYVAYELGFLSTEVASMKKSLALIKKVIGQGMLALINLALAMMVRLMWRLDPQGKTWLGSICQAGG